MKKLVAVLVALWMVGASVFLYANGNILVFADAEPYQVCIGWPDDKVFSWWCTLDYTARRLRETEHELWIWKQAAEYFEEKCVQ